MKGIKIGIVGVGFVGRAIQLAYTDNEVICRDPAKGYNASIEDLKHCTAIFVCVPSPQKNDGSCDTTLLESVLDELKDYKGVIISKVTAPPSEYVRLEKKHPHLVYAPEFLTAANAIEDYKNTKFLIVGGNNVSVQIAVDVILLGLPENNIVVKETDIATASLAKYTINSFLATKVAFMNELYDVAEASNINYNELAELVALDERIGSSHMQVPGPDGNRGFAGACFPKDTAALAHYAHKTGEDLSILEQVIRSNKFIRIGR